MLTIAISFLNLGHENARKVYFLILPLFHLIRESAVEEDNKGYSQTRSFPHNSSVSLEPYLDSYQPPTTNIGKMRNYF